MSKEIQCIPIWERFSPTVAKCKISQSKLVDFINQERKRNQKMLLNAVVNAGVARFRPVFLTSLTTFFGLLPLLFEKSTQAQFLIPMAISMAFGIAFATMITLLLVPASYLMAYELRTYWRLWIGHPDAAENLENLKGSEQL